MAVRQRLVTSEEGRPLLVKSAPPGPDADRLVHEAALLQLAAHPGVVTVVADPERADGSRELHLAIAGARTAADLDADAVGVAGLIAALATTVADLHDLGVVHGRIAADHVVIDRAGRPVLCGLAGAAPIGVVPWGGTSPLQPADDVAAVGRLLAQLLDRAAESADGRRGWGWRPAGTRATASLRAIAEVAAAPDPDDRPTAGELAAAVLAAMPAARLPDVPPRQRVAAVPGPVPPRRRGVETGTGPTVEAPVAPLRRRVVAGPGPTVEASVPPRRRRVEAGLGPTVEAPTPPLRRGVEAGPGPTVESPVPPLRPLSVVREPVGPEADGNHWQRFRARALRALGLDSFAVDGPPGGDPTVRARVAGHPSVTAAPQRRNPLLPVLAVLGLGLLAFGVGGLLRPSGPTPSPAPAAPEPEPVAGPPASRGPATTASTPEVEVDGARYAVGGPGDVVAVGDWDCDGTATAAVVRPATGEVFVFDDWATAGHDATAAVAAEVPGAASAAGVDADGDGCPTLVVTDAAGATTEVPA